MRRLTLLTLALALAAQVDADPVDAQIRTRTSTTSTLRLDLSVEGVATSGNWLSIAGGTMVLEVQTTATDDFRSSAPQPRIDPVTVRRQVMARDNDPWMAWLNAVVTGDDSQAHQLVEAALVDTEDRVVSSREFRDALPTRYVFPQLHAGNDGPMTESFVFQPRSIEGPTRGGSASSEGRLTPLTSQLFQVDWPGATVLSVTFGDLEIPAVESTDRAGRLMYQPGQPVFGPVTLEARWVEGSPFQQLWTDAWQGQDARVNFSVTLLAPDRQEVRVYEVINCEPRSYGTSDWSNRGSRVLMETLTCQPQRIVIVD